VGIEADENRSARTWTFSNVIAGSDSVTVVMRTAMYHLLANPATLSKLMQELRDVDKATGLTRPCPKWNEVKELRYLDAVVMEAVRLHPPFCLPLERVVPEGGVDMCGRHFPEGTCIGMNPYVVNRHRPTFGEDAEEWRPERWMVPEQQRKKLEGSIMTVSFLLFG
jgi:cytochrome P450